MGPRQTGDKFRISVGLDTLGEIALAEGDYARARPLFEQSLAMCREAGNRHRMADELRNLGHTARFEGSFGDARALSRALYRKPGSLWRTQRKARRRQRTRADLVLRR
jgi:hypothetical protein